MKAMRLTGQGQVDKDSHFRVPEGEEREARRPLTCRGKDIEVQEG